MNSVVTAQI